MVRIYEMRQKEVINCSDGCRFGFICDIEVDIECGKIVSIIVPGPAKILGIFGRDQEYKIPWDCITKIGDDIILIDIDTKEVLVDCNY